MATVFWYAKGIIMLDFLPKRNTITGVYYVNLLDQLRTAIREKRRGKLSKGVLLDNTRARVHTCKVAMDAVERNRYELMQHLDLELAIDPPPLLPPPIPPPRGRFVHYDFLKLHDIKNKMTHVSPMYVGALTCNVNVNYTNQNYIFRLR